MSGDAVAAAGERTPVTWDDIEAAWRRGATGALPVLFRGMPEKERKTLVAGLKERQAALRTGAFDWEARRRHVRMLKLVGPAVLGGPAGIAQWLAKRDFAIGRGDTRDPLNAAVVAVICDRNPAWVGDVAERLAQRLTVRTWTDNWYLVDPLARIVGTPPAADAYVPGWLATRGRTTGLSLTDALRADPFTPAMVPRIFETDGIGADLVFWGVAEGTKNPWAVALRVLADEGVVDRGVLVDRLLGRILRGAEPRHMQGFLQLHEGLEITDDEAAARAVTYLRLLPDSPAPVAAVAQAVLRRLDEAGRLTAEQVEEATRSVLFRSEKKVVRPQLTWLGKAVKQHADHAGLLVAAAATAFAHPDTGIQDRTLAFIAKQLPKLAESQAEPVREELRAAVDLLTGTTRAGVLELLGESAPETETDDVPVYVSAELSPEIASLDELVTELAAFLAGLRRNQWSGARNAASYDPWYIEHLVTALLREQARDRDAFVEALRILAHNGAATVQMFRGAYFRLDTASALIAAISAGAGLGGPPADWSDMLFGLRVGEHRTKDLAAGVGGPHRILAGRLFEVAERLRAADTLPYLSRIADAQGYIDPAAFVQGLETCAALGREPWPLDLEQALLRLPAAIAPELVDRAAHVPSEAGKWAAEVMAAGGMPAVDVSVVAKSRPQSWFGSEAPDYLLAVTGEVPAMFARGVLAGALCGMTKPMRAFRGQEYMPHRDAPCLPPVAPAHRDLVAAHVLFPIIGAEANGGPGVDVLPVLAAADGTAGPGMALVFAYGLAARAAEDRAHAVDGLITLAGRGTASWDPGDLGRTLVELIRIGGIKTSRVTESLRQAVAGGASAAVWGVMAGLIPALRGERPAGLGDLLAVAAESAARSGARESLPGLEPYLKKGTSRIAVEARRLETILAG